MLERQLGRLFSMVLGSLAGFKGNPEEEKKRGARLGGAEPGWDADPRLWHRTQRHPWHPIRKDSARCLPLQVSGKNKQDMFSSEELS